MKQLFALLLVFVNLNNSCMLTEYRGYINNRQIASLIDALITINDQAIENEDSFIFPDYKNPDLKYVLPIELAESVVNTVEELVVMGVSKKQQRLFEKSFYKLETDKAKLRNLDLARIGIARLGQLFVNGQDGFSNKKLRDIIEEQKQLKKS